MTDVDDLNVDITNHPMWEVISQLDVPLGTDGVEINSHMDADRAMRAIAAIDKEIEDEFKYLSEAVEFYQNRVNQRKNAQDYFKEKIAEHLEYLKDQGQPTKVATPAGTAYFTTRKSVEWPDDETLLDYAKSMGLEIKVKESVSKTDVGIFVRTLGVKPKWYKESESTSLVIKMKK